MNSARGRLTSATLRSLLAAVLVFAAVLAPAGHYDIEYVVLGLNAHIVGPSGTPWVNPYWGVLNQDAGGGGISEDEPHPPLLSPPGIGSVECWETILVRFYWKRDFPEDDPPSALVLKKYAVAGWGGEFGSASNGLGDPLVNGPDGGSSQGTHYDLIQNPGEAFERQITPAAYAYLTSPWLEVANASASVYVRYEAWPITIESTFAVRSQGALCFLVGQQADFSVTGGGASFDQHFWLPGHRCIGGVWFGNQYESRTTFLPVSLDQAHPSWYYEGKEDKSATIKCSVRVTVQGEVLGMALVKRKLQIWTPVMPKVGLLKGPATIFDPDPYSTSDSERALAGSDGSRIDGILIEGSVTLPSLFTTAQGYGQWTYVQLVERTITGSVGTTTEPWGLDTRYPYGGWIFSATARIWVDWRPTIGKSILVFADSPSISVREMTWYLDLFRGECFFVLRPPVYAGQSRVDIPLKSQNWRYNSNSDRPAILWQQLLSYVLRPFGWETTPHGLGVTVQAPREPAYSSDMDWSRIVN